MKNGGVKALLSFNKLLPELRHKINQFWPKTVHI